MQTKIYTTTSGDKWSETGGQSPMVPLFNSIHPISKGAIDFLNTKSYPVRVKKGKFLLKAGQIADRLFLVTKGVIRGFIKEEKKRSQPG